MGYSSGSYMEWDDSVSNTQPTEVTLKQRRKSITHAHYSPDPGIFRPYPDTPMASSQPHASSAHTWVSFQSNPRSTEGCRDVVHPSTPPRHPGTSWKVQTEQGATQSTLSHEGAPSLPRLNRQARLMQAVKFCSNVAILICTEPHPKAINESRWLTEDLEMGFCP